MRAHLARIRAHLARISVGLVAIATLFMTMAGVTAAPATAAGSPITIALVTPLTGAGAPEYQNAEAGFLARIEMQNAQGGVNGHKIKTTIVNDQTSPTAIVTGVQNALSQGVFGIVSNSPLFFEAAKYPQQAGIPVTGSFQDGPEWGEQPYTNMFAADNGSVDPKYPVNTLAGTILKHFGATVLGAYGYSISPTSTRAAIGAARAFQHYGGKVGVIDTTLPFGTVDFTSAALTAKQKHVNAIVPTMDDNSNFALATNLKQAGVKLKASLFATGYEPSVIGSPVWATLQGDYFESIFRPFSLPNAGTEQMQAALMKYQHFTKDQFPTFEQYEAWVGADLMIKGLEKAGPNPTHASVIKALRGITNYNANGLLPYSFDYKTNFGHDPAQSCVWVLQAQKSGFVPTQSQPFCGKDIPGTSTVSG